VYYECDTGVWAAVLIGKGNYSIISQYHMHKCAQKLWVDIDVSVSRP